MARVVWSARSQGDVAEIYAWIRKDSPAAATSIVVRFLAAGRRLEDNPESGRLAPDLEGLDVREMNVSPYRILYRVGQGTVGIITVRHAARQLKKEDV